MAKNRAQGASTLAGCLLLAGAHQPLFNPGSRTLDSATLLPYSPSHPHGIKVRLTSGQVGRVQAVITPGE